MSQDTEDYINPIFPLETEDEEDEILEDSGVEDDTTMVGGGKRGLIATLYNYQDKFMNSFKKGYSTMTSVYLPPIDLSKLVPATEKLASSFKKLPEGDSKATTYDIVSANWDSYDIKELKNLKDMASYAIFPTQLQTTPIFYLSVFLTKALVLSHRLDTQKKKPTNEENTELVLLLEIVVRLYILSYINIYTQNEMCIDPQVTGLYIEYIKKKQTGIKPLSAFLTDLETSIGPVSKCLFGNDMDEEEAKGNLEVLYSTLRDHGMKYMMINVFNMTPENILIISNHYFFDSMEEFLTAMKAEAAKAEAASGTGTSTASGTTTPPPPPPGKTCADLKVELDKLPEATRKALTDVDVAALAAVDATYKKAFIEDCFKDATLFPPTEYGFAVASLPPPPPPKTCTELKAEIDKLPEATRKALTDADVATLTTVDSIYTKKFIQDCFTTVLDAAGTRLFPEKSYGFAPTNVEEALLAIVEGRSDLAINISKLTEDTLKAVQAKYSSIFADVDAIKAAINDYNMTKGQTFSYEVEKTKEQCDEVEKFLASKAWPKNEIPLKEVMEFLLTPPAVGVKLNIDVFKACMIDFNGRDPKPAPPFSILEDVNVNKDVFAEPIDVPSDGWCFYHAIKLKEEPYSTDDTTSKFIGEIKNWIMRPENKANRENIWGPTYATSGMKGASDPATYDEYINQLDRTPGKMWANPELGIGAAVANIIGKPLNIWDTNGGTYKLIGAPYTPDAYAPPSASSPIDGTNILFVSDNHYNRLIPQTEANADPNLVGLLKAKASMMKAQGTAEKIKADPTIVADADAVITGLIGKFTAFVGSYTDLSLDNAKRAAIVKSADEMVQLMRDIADVLKTSTSDAGKAKTNLKAKSNALNAIKAGGGRAQSRKHHTTRKAGRKNTHRKIRKA